MNISQQYRQIAVSFLFTVIGSGCSTDTPEQYFGGSGDLQAKGGDHQQPPVPITCEDFLDDLDDMSSSAKGKKKKSCSSQGHNHGHCHGHGHSHGHGNCNDNGHGHSTKVDVCHIPPGNPAAKHTINISINAVPAHLAHGDYLGACNGTPPDPDQLIIICQNNVTKLVPQPDVPALLEAGATLGKCASTPDEDVVELCEEEGGEGPPGDDDGGEGPPGVGV